MTLAQNPEGAKAQLRRSEIKRILGKHRGSIQRIADSLNPPVSNAAVWMWLNGRTPSARIAEAALAEALRLRGN